VAAFLYQLGHRDFLLLAGDRGHVTGDLFGQRDRALKTALEAQAACNVIERRVPRHSIAAAQAAVVVALASAPRPTAIVCADDVLACGALWGCDRLGLAVPRDVSIVGFGDSQDARDAEPPLTSLREPIEDVGRAVASSVLARLTGRPAPVTAVSTAKLIVRASTGPAPDAG